MRRLGALLVLIASTIAVLVVFSRPDRPAGIAGGPDESQGLRRALDREAELDSPETLKIEPQELGDPAESRAAIDGRELHVEEATTIIGRLLLRDRPAEGARVRLVGPLPKVYADTVSTESDLDRVVEEAGTRTRLSVVRDSSGATVSRESSRLPTSSFLAAESTAGSDGDFGMHVTIDASQVYVLSASHSGHELFRRVDLAPRQRVDLGEMRFAAPGWILGRIEDPGRNLPATDAWVRAHRPGVDAAEEGGSLARALVDPATRTFALQEIPAGRVELSLDLPEFPSVVVEEFLVTPGAESEVELVYRGRNLSDALWIGTEPAYTIALDEAPESARERPRVELLRDGEPVGEPIRYRGVLLFKRLRPGIHELVLDDPRFLPVHIDGIEPGRGIRLPLVGSASLQLCVLDAASGTPLDSYWACLTPDFIGHGMVYHELQRTDRAPPPGGTYEGLVAGWSELVVAARGKGRVRVSLDHWENGDTQSIEVVLGATFRIEGSVVDETGAAIENATVELLAPPPDLVDEILARRDPTLARRGEMEAEFAAQIVDARRLIVYSTGSSSAARPIACCITGAGGRFVVGGVAAGTWILRTSSTTHVSPTRAMDVDGEDVSGIQLVMHRAGRWKGRFVLPPSVEPERCLVRIERHDHQDDLEGFGFPPEEERVFTLESSDSKCSMTLNASGGFLTPPLRPGEYAFDLVLPNDYELPSEDIRIEAGKITDRTIDVTDRMPGLVELEATWKGLPASDHLVWLSPPFDLGADSIDHFDVLDGAGRSSRLSLAPGDRYLFLMKRKADKADPPGFHVERIRIEPGVEQRIRIEADPAPGHLLVLDSHGGGLLRERSIWCGVEGWPAQHWFELETDESGGLDLALAPGRYGFRASTNAADACAWVEWTSSGPQPATISLPGAVGTS